MGFTVSVDDQTAALTGIAERFSKVEKSAEKAGKSLDKVGDKKPSGLMNKDNLRDAQDGLQNAGIALLGMGTAGFAGLGFAAHEAAAFQQGIAEVGTLVDHSKFSVEDMTKTAHDMATTFGGDVMTQVAGLYQGISSGADTATKANYLMTAANQLAIAGHTDQTTAVTGLTKIMNNFNLTLDKSAEVSDALFVAVRGGQTTIGELGHVIGELAAGAKSAGIPYEELIAILGTGATLMGDTSKAATGLKAIMQGIAHPTSDAAAEAKKLGVVFSSKGLRDAGSFQNFIKQITGSAKFGADSLNQLFSSGEAAQAVIALTANKGQAFTDMLEAMRTRSGLTAQAFKEMSETLSRQGEILKAKVQVTLEKMGVVLLPILTKLAKGFGRLLDTIGELPDPVIKIMVGMVAMGSAMSVVMGGTFLLAAGILACTIAAKAIGIAILAVSGAFVVVGAAIAAVVVAIYGFKEAIDKNIGGMGTMLSEGIAKTKLFFAALEQLFKDGGFSGAVLEQLEDGNEGVENFAVKVAMWGARIMNFFDGVKQGFENTMTTLGPALEGLQRAFNSVTAVLFGASESVDEAQGKFDAFGSAGSRLGNILGGVFEFIVKAITGALEIARGFIDGLKSMSWAFAPLKGAIMTTIGAFTSMSGSTGASTSTFQMLGKVVSVVVGIIAAGIGLLATGWSIGFQIITAAIDWVMIAFTVFGESVSGIVNIIAGIFTGDWSRIWLGAQQWVHAFVTLMVSTIAAGASMVAGIVDSLAGIFGKDLGAKKLVEGAKTDLLKGMKDMTVGGDIAGVFSTTPTTSGSGPSGLTLPPAAVPVGAPLAPVGGTAGAGLPATNAGAAQGALMSSVEAAGSSRAASPPMNVELTSKLVVDGEVLASVMEKQKLSSQSRNFTPVPNPT